ncbi:MAG: carboxypeptidase regulatory-like domain-containing protein [Acidobacteria bacterium]|nr:carboxypeptidase regulatory-like domain-containing protein [Acidobacteriota bacterium]
MVTVSGVPRYALVTLLMVGLAGVYGQRSPQAAGEPLLAGKVVAAGGQALAGVPVRAHRENSTIAVNVYTDSRGEYSFPGWSALSPGSHSVTVELPDFERATQDATLAAGKTTRVDFTLRSRQPTLPDATAAEIVAGLPGTDEQKHLVIQCDNCHSLQFALRTGRTKDEWIQIIRRMAGERAVSRETPGTRAFGQKKYVEPLAEYLASIRGPGAADPLPFRLRPRPTGDTASMLVVTEYGIPRAGHRDLNILRGDRRFAWPHDILLDSKSPYAYYTDHFTFTLGRLDRRTGEVKEFPYTLLSGMGREEGGAIAAAQRRAGNPGGGAHDIAWDPDGNVIIGMGGGTVRFNPRTQEFTPWAAGSNMFGIDPTGRVWFLDKGLHALDMKTGDVKHYDVPPGTDDDTYDMETDAGGRSIMNLWRLGKMGVFDPQTGQFSAYQVPTPGSGPRRGELDARGRAWVTLYWAGRIAMFDPDTREIREYPIIPGHQPYTPPFPSPYSLAVDDRHQIVWTNDFNTGRIYRLDARTGASTEFLMPEPYEIRDLTVDDTADRPTVWIPVYRPPAKMVKVEMAN